MQPCGPQAAKLLCPWVSPGKSTGVGCHDVLQGIFLTQGSNLRLLCLLHLAKGISLLFKIVAAWCGRKTLILESRDLGQIPSIYLFCNLGQISQVVKILVGLAIL